MKPRHLVLGGALVLALWLVLGDEPAPLESAPVAAVPANRPGPAASAVRTAAKPVEKIARLVPRDELIGDDTRFGQGAGVLFGHQDWTPPPPPPPKPAPPPPPPPPTAPPLPYTYIGKSLQGGVWEVYLTRGQQVHMVRDGALLDGQYRVDAIRPPVLSLTYLPLNEVQQLHIGAFE